MKKIKVFFTSAKFKAWLKASGIRAFRTFVQAFVACLGSSSVFAEVNWGTVIASAVFAAFLSMCTSIGGLPEVALEEQVKELEKQNNSLEDYFDDCAD